MRAIVADDELLARDLLRRMLGAQGVDVVAEGGTGMDALTLIDAHRPDLAFLDIRMPDLDGMEAAAALLQFERPPLLVFVTGFAEYAPEAFEKAAFDYLLKPVAGERLATTLARARRRIAEGNGAPPLMAAVRRLPVRTDYAVRLLRVEGLLCAVANQKRVFLKTTEGEELKTSYTLTQLESLLPPSEFMRVHASAIVRLDAVEQINFLGNHTYSASLTGGTVVPVGRAQYPELQRTLGVP